MIIIPEALQVYCILVKHFGFDDSWTSFENGNINTRIYSKGGVIYE